GQGSIDQPTHANQSPRALRPGQHAWCRHRAGDYEGVRVRGQVQVVLVQHHFGTILIDVTVAEHRIDSYRVVFILMDVNPTYPAHAFRGYAVKVVPRQRV